MSNKRATQFDDPMMTFEDPALSAVVSLPEAMVMWGKSRRTIEMAFWKGQLSARKCFTGGAILISRASLVRKWGPPVNDVTDALLMPGSFEIDLLKGGK